MAHRKYSLTGGLNEEDLQNIFEEILQVLEKTGIEVDHAEILDFLSSQPGIKIDGKRIKYDRQLVKEFIPLIKKQNAEYSYNRKDGAGFRLVGPFMGVHYTDIDTGALRLATEEDFIQAVKLCDVLRFYGPSPIHLQTVPAHLRQVATEKICAEYSREVGGYCVAESPQEAELMCRIGQAAGRPPPYCALEIPISPLKLNYTSLDIIYRNRDHRYNLKGICLGGGAVPLLGASSPLFYPGMLVQGMAEALAAYITPKLIEPEVYGYCSFGGFIFDMRTMQPAKPFPEWALYWLAVPQIIRYVLGETFGVSFAFNPEDPADVFRIAFMTGLGICSDGASFLGVGSDRDGFNPVRAVIQADILRHCERFARGFQYREEKGLSSKVIEEALSTGLLGNYLDHPTTLEFRELYLEPELFFKYSGEELKAKARAVARQKIAEHTFRLPDEKRETLAKIYREADHILHRKQ